LQNLGIDPEMIATGIELAVFHIEAGSRTYTDFSKVMINDFGGDIVPFLRSFYEGARYYPGMEKIAKEMTKPEDIEKERKKPLKNISTEVMRETIKAQLNAPSAPDRESRQEPPKRPLKSVLSQTSREHLKSMLNAPRTPQAKPQPRIKKVSLGLEELKVLKPEELQIDRPNRDRYWEDHLLWLLDHRPDHLKELFLRKKGHLKRKLLRVVQRASILEMILNMEGNLEKDQIEERVYQIVAPPDDPSREPEPLPDELRQRILGWSWNLKIKTMS